MTDQAYQTELTRIKAALPNYPGLATMEAGNTPLGRSLMRQALRLLGNAQKPADQADPAPDARAIEHTDERYRWLHKEKASLYVQMRKERNRYHDCKTDKERAAVNATIQRMWQDFLVLKRKMEYFEVTGHHEPEIGEEKYPLPDDPVALLKKLNSIRATISAEKKKLRDLAIAPDSTEKTEKIKAAEARLADLDLYKAHAERVIENKSVHGE